MVFFVEQRSQEKSPLSPNNAAGLTNNINQFTYTCLSFKHTQIHRLEMDEEQVELNDMFTGTYHAS